MNTLQPRSPWVMLIEDSKRSRRLGLLTAPTALWLWIYLALRNSWSLLPIRWRSHFTQLKKPVQLRYGATRAHNRHMAEFCSRRTTGWALASCR